MEVCLVFLPDCVEDCADNNKLASVKELILPAQPSEHLVAHANARPGEAKTFS